MARRRKSEFRPDARFRNPFKTLHLTQLQRLKLLKWGLYILMLVLLLVIQDVIMCHISILGATTDLVVCGILLITVMEGSEVGCLFVLLASLLYYFSGSAPYPYVVFMITVAGAAATLFRQAYWHRNRVSIILCAGVAQMFYEISVYGMGLFLALTRWDRLGVFLLTGLLSWLVMIPLYPLVNKIGLIGGTSWKE